MTFQISNIEQNGQKAVQLECQEEEIHIITYKIQNTKTKIITCIQTTNTKKKRCM